VAVNGSNLFALFQPQAGTAPIYSVLTSWLEKKGRIGRGLRTTLTFFGGGALAGASVGILLAAPGLAFAHSGWRVPAVLAALALALVGAVVGIATSAALSAGKGLVANNLGMCDGMPGLGYGDAPAITPWLTDLLDGIAGITDEKRGQSIPRHGEQPEPLRKPLTFGDLWGTDEPLETHDIELQFVTTNVTHGRPHRLPYETTQLYFDPKEMKKYFPDWVVDWMENRRRKPTRAFKEGDLPSFVYKSRLCPFPSPADLPVVVAARLSLSFPFLFSAVPFYAVDFTNPDREKRTQERCWFSDGGLCSNFPVHFFDSPLPGWPTFAMNLRDLPKDAAPDTNEANNSQVVEDNGRGLSEWWTRFDRGGALAQLGGFAAAMVFTAKDWHDNVQLRVPGYRDRVVHVALGHDEGGLNLNMPSKLIERLGERGRLAGKRLGDRFSPEGDGTVMTWDNHRWIRFRSTVSLVEDELRAMRETLDPATPSGASYRALLARATPPSYDWASNRQRDDTLAWVDRLLSDKYLTAAKPVAAPKAPNPRPELRIVPRI
jgi:hypothetical protein